MIKTAFRIGLALVAPVIASAQCPADPLQTIANSSWAFNYHTPSGGIAAIGNFNASIVNGQGVLNG